MSNTFTKTDESVAGNVRILFGTLAMGDGAAGSLAGTGMNRVMQVVGTGSQMARLTHTGGGIGACTAASGASYQVVVYGN